MKLKRLLSSFKNPDKIITITPVAKSKLIEMLNHHHCNDALFYIKGGGCNGFKYMLEPIKDLTSIDKQDVPVPLTEDMHLRVCNKSLIYLFGSKIDWDSDFMGQSFRFENPNADSSCGCGATFAPKITHNHD